MAAVLFEIMEMTAQDYEEIAGLWWNTEGIGLDDDTDNREGIAAYLARNPGLSYVARQQGQIVGAVLCGHDGRRGYLHHLAVVLGHRHRGIGRALVEACLAKLGSIGIQKCNLFLFSGNVRQWVVAGITPSAAAHERASACSSWRCRSPQ